MVGWSTRHFNKLGLLHFISFFVRQAFIRRLPDVYLDSCPCCGEESSETMAFGELHGQDRLLLSELLDGHCQPSLGSSIASLRCQHREGKTGRPSSSGILDPKYRKIVYYILYVCLYFMVYKHVRATVFAVNLASFIERPSNRRGPSLRKKHPIATS